MSNYISLARYYDSLTYDVDYVKMADFYESVFSQYKIKPSMILDLACGTGTLTYMLADRGYDMIGTDASEDMLAAAADKGRDRAVMPLFLYQDMQDLDLYGTVSAALCALDGINYIPPEDLHTVFKKLSLFVEPGGVFIFDINSPEYLKKQDGEIFIDETDDIFCTWRAEYDEDIEACIYGFDIFTAQNGGLWQRFSEEHTEYAHSCETLIGELEKVGFTDISVYGNFEMRRPDVHEDRIVIAARNKN